MTSRREDPDTELARRVEEATTLLEALQGDYGQLAGVPAELRRRFLTAAGQIARPGPWARRELMKAARRRRREARRAADDAALAQTGIRRERAKPVFETPLLEAPEPPRAAPATEAREVADPRTCYVCKARFSTLHHYYDQMCTPCGDLNWAKRTQTADLSGRVALVTGARVKIGYQAAILLLRAGARVVVTTRFPRDAARRYAREVDFEDWKDRLQIHGLDLRHTPSVEAFARHLDGTLERLDVLINNACQTVRRPAGFYQHLLEAERRPASDLDASEAALLDSYEAMRALSSGDEPGVLARAASAAGLHDPATLSQLALLEDDLERSTHIFPAGQLDADLQQIDLRDRNSWRMALAEVPTVELLEVQLVNAVAPFVLNARLKPLMLRQPSRDKHIVNVSAMEGQFYRRHKTDKHPHTNMAKAALNMMTRTSAPDYARDGIHMNSVDTGWVTDEDPAELARRKTEVHRFHPPLDIVDGAARICDPIFSGVRTGKHVWGLFLKDYAPTDW